MADNEIIEQAKDKVPMLRAAQMKVRLNADAEMADLHAYSEELLVRYAPQLNMTSRLREFMTKMGWQSEDGRMPYGMYCWLFTDAMRYFSDDEEAKFNSLTAVVEAKLTAAGVVVDDSQPWCVPYYCKHNGALVCSYYIQVKENKHTVTVGFTFASHIILELSEEFLADVDKLHEADAAIPKYNMYILHRGDDKQPQLIGETKGLDFKSSTVMHSLYTQAFTDGRLPDISNPVEAPAKLIANCAEVKWDEFAQYQNCSFVIPANAGDNIPIGFLKDIIFVYMSKKADANCGA